MASSSSSSSEPKGFGGGGALRFFGLGFLVTAAGLLPETEINKR